MSVERRSVVELQNEYHSLREQLRDINDAAEAAGRTELTAEERGRWDELYTRAEAVKRSLQVAAMSNDPLVQQEAREVCMTLPYEYRLTTERAEMGRRFREVLSSGARGAGLPIELREAVTATTSTNVSAAIPVFVQDFVEPLEKGIIYGMLGMKIKTGLSGEVKYPIAPYIEATMENETVKLEDTTVSFESLTPSPRRIGISVPLTGLAHIQTDGAVYNWVVNAVVQAIARYLNRWMFMPTAIKENVYGVFAYNASANAIKQKTFAGKVPTYQELLAMRGEVMATGAYADGTYAYVMGGQMYATLEGTPRSNGSDKMIIEDGKIGGVPVYVTEEIEATGMGTYNVTAKHVGFGRFNDCMAHQFGGMNLVIDPFTGAKADVTYITLNTHWAVDVVRKGSFVIGTVTA